jgi:hypothetical protein
MKGQIQTGETYVYRRVLVQTWSYGTGLAPVFLSKVCKSKKRFLFENRFAENVERQGIGRGGTGLGEMPGE